jgi:hypothetical protein
VSNLYRRSGLSRVECALAKKKKKKLSACHGEGSAVGLQLRVRFVPASLLVAMR